MKIYSNKPSERWGEAFPLGNGHMGAMVYGSLPVNRIELSENTFFSGEKSRANNQKDAAAAFYRMRELARQGDYPKVHEAAKDFIGIRKNYGTNLPVGRINIDCGISRGAVSEYERSLDIMNGTAACVFTCEGSAYKEEIFVSHPDNILVCHISKDTKSKIKLSYTNNNAFGKVEYEGSSILFNSYAYENMHCDELRGVMLVGCVQIVTDGICTAMQDGIVVSQAMDIWLYLYMDTDFKREFADIGIAQTRLIEEVRGHVARCVEKGFEVIRNCHRKDMSVLMKRVDLQLYGEDHVVGRLPLLFQYGRYLLLSSSRGDSKLPAHLQGVWNDNVACRIGWTCDMHLDINTQMNYWPAERVNLSETTEPLFRWIEKDLAPAGSVTAKESYGLEGWAAELVSNAWGYAAPYWADSIAPCPTGGVWILMHMWEHYLYTLDEQFLRKKAYPLIESAAKFFSQYVFEDEKSGWLTAGPSISPENSFLYNNRAYQISNGCTYEILMIRELFQVYLQACSIAGDVTSGLYKDIAEKAARLLPYRLTGEGSIAEWSHDLPGADKQHRHTSHLLGLFPFSQITPEETPELCAAAKEAIRSKLTPPENWEDTGWARSMLMLYEARLHNGNGAYEHIKSMLEKLLEPNMLVYHPPTRGAGAFDHVYELDGNTGLTTCIAEMLLQSHKGVICLLPALPAAWETGHVSGLKARGNIEVSMAWNKGRLQYAKLTAKNSTTCRIFYRGQMREVNLIKDTPCIFKNNH